MIHLRARVRFTAATARPPQREAQRGGQSKDKLTGMHVRMDARAWVFGIIFANKKTLRAYRNAYVVNDGCEVWPAWTGARWKHEVELL